MTLMGIYWAAGGAGYPYGDGDPKGFDSGSVLVGMNASVGGPVITLVGLVGLGLASRLERANPRTMELGYLSAVCGFVVVVLGAVAELQPCDGTGGHLTVDLPIHQS